MHKALSKALDIAGDVSIYAAMIFGIGGLGVTVGIISAIQLDGAIETGALIGGLIGSVLAVIFARSLTKPF